MAQPASLVLESQVSALRRAANGQPQSSNAPTILELAEGIGTNMAMQHAHGELTALLVAAGCQKLNFSKTVNVPANILRDGIIFSPPAYEQKVTVTIEPEKGPVSAYLIKSSNQEAVEKLLLPNN